MATINLRACEVVLALTESTASPTEKKNSPDAALGTNQATAAGAVAAAMALKHFPMCSSRLLL